MHAQTTSYRHLFGPVPSRRYGRSLGVDLAVQKTCTLNCRFCQLGPTAATTLARTLAPPLEEVFQELRLWLSENPPADFITASGSGEPTLHARFGDLFRWVRSEAGCRSLLLTNGTLFFLPEVRREAALADVVKLSLHAWDQASFERVTRPHPSLRFDAILDGYRAFRQAFAGRIDLEVFIIPGLNDAPRDVERIAALAHTFSPDAITLNTAVRPPADRSVAPCDAASLHALALLFGPKAQEIGAMPTAQNAALSDEALVALISRHPLPLAALAATFRTAEAELRHRLDALAARRLIRLFEVRNTLFAGPPDADEALNPNPDTQR